MSGEVENSQQLNGTIQNNVQLNGTITTGGQSIQYTAGTGIDITDNVISNTITSYNDLTDLPTIPQELTINDKTSDMQINTQYITNTGWINCTTYGKICVVSLNVLVANNTPNRSVLISNLPKSFQDRVMFSGALPNKDSLRFYIEGTTLCNDGETGIAGWVDANVVYITE